MCTSEYFSHVGLHVVGAGKASIFNIRIYSFRAGVRLQEYFKKLCADMNFEKELEEAENQSKRFSTVGGDENDYVEEIEEEEILEDEELIEEEEIEEHDKEDELVNGDDDDEEEEEDDNDDDEEDEDDDSSESEYEISNKKMKFSNA